ncbi:hypothetical protein MPLB_1640014 [Mesorhizobium sp. ORS 3324]|nr:hypothetical protein MPLB_1640014 [Mesorhizobium sp. ORS 3324]
MPAKAGVLLPPKRCLHPAVDRHPQDLLPGPRHQGQPQSEVLKSDARNLHSGSPFGIA